MNEIQDTPKHSDLVYDVGMHKGEDTEFYLRKGFRVVAFEADPDLVRACRTRFGEFIAQGRLTIVEGAIVDSASTSAGDKILFYKNIDQSVWGTVHADRAARNARHGADSKSIEVNVVDLECVIREQGVPHYMKVDIEGSDLACLSVWRRFHERPDYISLECDKTALARVRREITMMSNLGYDCFQAIEQSGVPQSQSPPTPAQEGTFVEWRFEKGSSGLFGAELPEQWKSKREILRQYRTVALGYYLVGDDGVMKRWRFPGAGMIRKQTRRFLRRLTHAAVPGWYDTHARHSSVGAGPAR